LKFLIARYRDADRSEPKSGLKIYVSRRGVKLAARLQSQSKNAPGASEALIFAEAKLRSTFGTDCIECAARGSIRTTLEKMVHTIWEFRAK
jgi:hypothetical protein